MSSILKNASITTIFSNYGVTGIDDTDAMHEVPSLKTQGYLLVGDVTYLLWLEEDELDLPQIERHMRQWLREHNIAATKLELVPLNGNEDTILSSEAEIPLERYAVQLESTALTDAVSRPAYAFVTKVHTLETMAKNRKKRADVIVAEMYSAYSRAALAKLFGMGLVHLQDKQLKPGDRVAADSELQVDISPLEKPIAHIDLPILYEDDDVIVINKPSGVISHARGKYWDEPSVASFVRSRLSGMQGERAGIVHRLDRATSGVMICAKNQQALSSLQQQFADRKVTKIYQAVVGGTPQEEEAYIDMPIERNPKAPATFRAGINGKAARTKYTVRRTNGTHSLVTLLPETGRTHQLRVHLKEIGNPIVGDALYGGEQADRLMLHAYQLTIVIPSGEVRTFTAPIPRVFEDYCSA